MINLTLGGMSGGYRTYLRKILPRLAACSKVQAILCAAPARLNVPDWFEPMPNVAFTDSGTVRALLRRPRGHLRQELDAFSPDVLFVPLARPFRFDHLPVVNMVQNMEPLAYDDRDNPLLERIKNLLRRRAARSAAAHADGFIAVSNFVRDFLVNEWSVPAERIAVAHYGPTDPAGRCVRPTSVPAGWAGDFIFTAGAIRPARGLEDLIDAMGSLAERNVGTKLVIAGATDPRMSFYRRAMEARISQHNLHQAVVWTGRVSKEEMDWCYRNCKIFVMTSRVESFGVIGMEAMVAGCVCVAADNPSLPEVFAEAAVFYPPKDAAALGAVVERLLCADSEELKRMSAAARGRAAEFSWDTCAHETATQLAWAAKGRPP